MIKSHKQLIVKKFKKISNNHNKVLKSQHTSRSKKKKVSAYKYKYLEIKHKNSVS